jgi:hypothetical protein
LNREIELEPQNHFYSAAAAALTVGWIGLAAKPCARVAVLGSGTDPVAAFWSLSFGQPAGVALR